MADKIKKVILPTDDDSVDTPEFVVKDDGVYKENELVVSSEDIIKKEYTITDGVVKAKDGKDIELNDEFFNIFKQTDDVIEFEGKNYKKDDKGNLLDDAGNIFKTADDYNKYITDSVIEVEDKDGNIVKLKLDKDGNALSNEGKVVFTKDQLSKLGDTTQEQAVKINDIISRTNLQILDKDNKPVSYDDNADGLSNYVLDVYEQGKRDASVSELAKLYEQYPELKNIVSHVVLNGTLEGYNKSTAKVTSIKLDDKTSDADITSIIVQAKMMKGESEEEATRLAKYYIADGKGLEAAKKEQQYILAQQTEAEKAAAEQVKINEQQQINAYKSYWGGLLNDQGKFVNDNIPDSVYDLVINKKQLKVNDDIVKLPSIIKRKLQDGKVVNSNPAEFFDYLIKPMRFEVNGETFIMTADQIDREIKASKSGKDGYLYESLLNFTGGDIKQLVDQQVKNEEAKKVKRLKVDLFPEDIKTVGKNKNTGKVLLPMD